METECSKFLKKCSIQVDGRSYRNDVFYIHNMSCKYDVNVTENTKFLANKGYKLDKSNIRNLMGYPANFTLYKPEEIVAWFNPVKINIPKNLAMKSEKRSRHYHVNSTSIDIEHLDFGGNRNVFVTKPLIYVNPYKIDFGDENGLFGC